jgi:dipeptidyl aminopeptidase/acylaminoacyl peptidase
MRKFFYLLAMLVLVELAHTQTTPSRYIHPSDVYKLKSIRNPKISPDGQWILYNVSRADSTKDKFVSKLYMISRNGKDTVALTEQTKSPGQSNWSPDGKYISFTTVPKDGKEDDEVSQIFLMDRRGGEPFQVTNTKGEIQSYKWSEDGSKIVLAIKDPNNADTAKTKIRKPYEINRFKFKQDYMGYLDNRKTHLYLFDVKTRKMDTLTKGNFNETKASFSYDGTKIVYVSNRTEDPDRNSNTDIFVLDLKDRSTPKQLTTFKGEDDSPCFSPDDQWIAYIQSSSTAEFNMYDQNQLGIVNLNTGLTQILTTSLDRPITEYVWASDSKNILFLAEDDRKQNLYSINIEKKNIEAITKEEAVYQGLHSNTKGDLIALYSYPDMPDEIYVFENGKFKQVTHVHEALMSTFKKIYKKGFTSTSKDGTKVSGILYLPDSSSKKLPLILFIHGGPVAQDDYAFDQTREILAGAGFAVAAVNYRGSSGRGLAFCKAIYADWGNKEVMDILGATDYLVQAGYGDASKLAIAGWSYGGILTNYTIATDQRFKAAASGAGSSLQFSIYGTDQYINQYEREIGSPWKNVQKWIDISYPFFKVEKIKTPTLFMASQNDFNVPVAGAEQMYQAFKSVGIPTELIIYPNQNHGIIVPSYIVHRYERQIEWFRKYLK